MGSPNTEPEYIGPGHPAYDRAQQQIDKSHQLTDSDVERIAQRVVALLRESAAAPSSPTQQANRAARKD